MLYKLRSFYRHGHKVIEAPNLDSAIRQARRHILDDRRNLSAAWLVDENNVACYEGDYDTIKSLPAEVIA